MKTRNNKRQYNDGESVWWDSCGRPVPVTVVRKSTAEGATAYKVRTGSGRYFYVPATCLFDTEEDLLRVIDYQIKRVGEVA